MPDYYNMDGQPIPMLEWAALMENGEARTVARDEVGDLTVSTVLLGLDHRFGGADGPPVIFETMVFGHAIEAEFQWRYATKEQALAGHRQVVAAILAESLTHDAVTA